MAILKNVALCIFFLTVYLAASAQTGRTVVGKVTDTAGVPLQGASIRVKGTKLGTSTDAQGRFTFSTLQNGKTLIISYVGYENQEFRLTTEEKDLIIVLKDNGKKADETVVVGYATRKRLSMTAAVSTIKGADIANQPVADLTNAIGGRTPGVLFAQPSGLAGNDAAQIFIRGIATTGNNQPLIIVDGIPRNFSQLNPADIESMSILKDAAAVAPYGMGGANGVVLITTKKGKIGVPTLTYDGYAGIVSPTVISHSVSAYTFALMKNAGAANDGLSAPFSSYALQKYKDGSDRDAYPNTDPVKDMLLTNRLQTGHSLSLSGGTEKVKYAMGLGYFYQDGNLPQIHYNRYNVSANLEAHPTNSTTVALSLNGRVEQRHFNGAGSNGGSVMDGIVENTLSITPLKFSNGDHSSNYAGYYDNQSYQQTVGNVLLSNLSIEQKLPLKGLSVKFVAAYDFNPYDAYSGSQSMIASLSRNWSQPFTYYIIDTSQHPHVFTAVPPTTLPGFSESYNQTQAFDYQGYLNYARTFGKSAVTGFVVLEARTTKSATFSASRANYQVPISELFAGSSVAADISNNGSSQETKQRSLVYGATYAFDNKYLFEAGGRYDGSYYFAPGHRYGFFPSFSAGWRISQESFMRNVTWLTEFKVRGSWGESGALAGAPFQYLSAYSLYGNSAILNGVATQGLYENSQANPNITWEKAKKTDVGFDATVLNFINVQMDYFYEKRDNMLIQPSVTVPAEYGIGLNQVNGGVMSNHGFEFSAGASHRMAKDLTVGLNLNFTYARNKVINIYQTQSQASNPNRTQTGRPLGEWFGYKAIGYFTQNDFDGGSNLKSGIATQPWGAVHPGDIRYEDVNHNGKIDVDDQVPIGLPSGYPGIVYGFSPTIRYKNIELNILFQGAADRTIQLGYDAVWPFFNGRGALKGTENYWTPQHPNAPNPRITSSPAQNNIQQSSFWQRDLSYLRLRTGLLNYYVPAGVAKKMGMTAMRVYVSCQNPFVWSKLKNFDPELSSNRAFYYSTQKVLSVGINAQF